MADFWRKTRAFLVMILVNSAWTMPMSPEYSDYLQHIMSGFWGGPDPYATDKEPSEEDIQDEIDADLAALFRADGVDPHR